MTNPASLDPTECCEEILRTRHRDNVELDICPSENAIIEVLLGRRTELIDAYAELHTKLGDRPPAIEVFFDTLLGVADVWSPEKMVQARAGRQRLATVNREIAEKSNDLAKLLREREQLNNSSGFSGNTHYHVCDVIEDAARDNYLFGRWVRDGLQTLSRQFDLKYWPKIHDFLDALARNADDVALSATDRITAAGTSGIRASQTDFFRALFTAIEENSSRLGSFLPADLKLSDATLASLANCSLNLGPDELVGSDYVKGIRARKRKIAQERDDSD